MAYLIFLKENAGSVFKVLFPRSPKGAGYIAVREHDIKFLDYGIEIPARPEVMDVQSQETRVQEGRLVIFWHLIDFWFEYKSELDRTVRPIGFHSLTPEE